jgi:hypothetical protein
MHIEWMNARLCACATGSITVGISVAILLSSLMPTPMAIWFCTTNRLLAMLRGRHISYHIIVAYLTLFDPWQLDFVRQIASSQCCEADTYHSSLSDSFWPMSITMAASMHSVRGGFMLEFVRQIASSQCCEADTYHSFWLFLTHGSLILYDNLASSHDDSPIVHAQRVLQRRRTSVLLSVKSPGRPRGYLPHW